ncbi:mediator of RNA polymerase II transcription subunit 26-like isoform X2 [Prorops nasuta]
MGAVVDVITALEKTTITKEVLEITRLGKYINELRRKTNNDTLAKRAKDLVRRWRDMVLPSAHSTPQPTPADTAPPALNGAKPQSPALRGFKPQSPALRGLKPQSPLLKDATPLRVISPALSVHSEHSSSPNASLNRQSITPSINHRINSDIPTVLGSSSQNHVTEAVPRTHSSNKRLRKDEKVIQENDSDSNIDCEHIAKRQRLNGENTSGNINSQVPSPTFTERISEHYVESSTDPDGSGPKKRGRKKGSKSMKKQTLPEDRVKEKLASISRNPKLKTTQELLADLQARGSNSSTPSGAPPSQSMEPPSMEDILRSSNDQVNKFLRSAQNNSSHRSGLSESSLQSRLKPLENCRDSTLMRKEEDKVTEKTTEKSQQESQQTRPNQELTVEEILAKLPPLDPSSINWSDCDTESNEDRIRNEFSPHDVAIDDLERLHSQCIEGLNGNFQPKLSSLTSDLENIHEDQVKQLKNGVNDVSYNQTAEEFREWHQMLARPSFDGQILHILPYVIID